MRDQWTDFFLGEAGAAAALTGLIVVAMSINISEIVGDRILAGRAGETIAIITGALVAASLMLVPEQDTPWLGVELVVVAVFTWVIPVRVQQGAVEVGLGKAKDTFRSRILCTQAATLPAIVAAGLLMAGLPAGYAVLAFGILATFVVSILNAWVLLVEILR